MQWQKLFNIYVCNIFVIRYGGMYHVITTNAEMCPQWSAQTTTQINSHHSDKIATTTDSLISTKISTPMKMLSLNYQLLYVAHTHVHM